MKYGIQCFCDNFIRNEGALTKDNSECGMNCGGNFTQKCGAGNRLSVCSNTTLQIYQPPTAQKAGLPGKWSYAGCMSDAAGFAIRTLQYKIKNTAANCSSLCSQYRYNAAGMQFGQECWCGDMVNVAPNGGKLAAETECNIRVISNIVALPDSTYLILNGAQQGRAGFGLAKNPNFNAVLCDPRRPLHSRMSVMSNTTDGRFLVSGSDPQDGEGAGVRYPEEYRVEVFTLGYLLKGKTRPSYTISNKDWAYGQSVTMQLTHSNKTGAIEISLTGAEASTHANNMGQRTIFPQFKCVGGDASEEGAERKSAGTVTTCTITAPPNSRVCPPGWFQLWVLEGGVPSRNRFVRIGGDPGRLGEWPGGGGFRAPGV
ncbi:hypothetical protein EG328_001562 [Venturia inaequalis]|uniref:WSC domain-containing protein n=1 Tax=Venturia inaequalis TaxID=5025 RepID=A0A8H3Z392_VENIN|nr:hypothetical protein EG328_001562 [Venturia inaequalis]